MEVCHSLAIIAFYYYAGPFGALFYKKTSCLPGMGEDREGCSVRNSKVGPAMLAYTLASNGTLLDDTEERLACEG